MAKQIIYGEEARKSSAERHQSARRYREDYVGT